MANVFEPVERARSAVEKPEKLIFTRGLWSNNSGNLLTFFTSSLQNATSKAYYYQVWQSASNSCDEYQAFSVAYGHISGSGSLNSGGEVSDTPSRAIYSQYRLLCLNPEENSFYHYNSTTRKINHFYAINFDRNRVGDKLDPGNFEISIAELNGGAHSNNAFTGSNVAVSSSGKVITLIDDSGDATDTLGYGGIPSNVRSLVSGTIDGGIYSTEGYGLVFADLGVILIDADMLNTSASFNTVTGSNIAGDNSFKIFTAISGAGDLGSPFTARAVDIKEQDFYFVRVKNRSFNYSNNPTFKSGSNGELAVSSFRFEPNTYVTSIGLYNDQRELLAVAKVSQPLQKSFNSELSITVKLEY